MRLIPQQSTHLATCIICQWCNRFGGYPRDKYTNAHIDGKIDCKVHWIVYACSEKVIIEENIQRLHNQKLPHNQSKALFSQKLRKFIAQQGMITKAAMDTNNDQTRTKCIERDYIYKAWQQHRGKQT